MRERNDQKEGNKQEKDLTEKREAAEEPGGELTKGWLRWSTGAPAVPLFFPLRLPTPEGPGWLSSTKLSLDSAGVAANNTSINQLVKSRV